jgi:5-hydroxyisourate hydrolase-like protein (transthyretin family)
MRRTLQLTLAVLLMCPAASAAQQAARQPEKASVEGVVLRSGSGEPLSRVQVTLRRIPDQQENEIPRLLTQDDGKFSFENLQPGQFELTVARNGYARQVYGQRTAGGRGNLITLAEGQALKGVTFRMVQGGVISGRVRDFRGEAVAGYQVFLMKSEYTEDGKRRLTDAAGTVTDDRGEYRLYWIPPGRYFLLASQFLKEKKDGLGPDVVPDQVFPATYYPGVADLPRAVTIEVRPGAELGAMDIVLPQPAVYRIRGRVVDGSTGRPPPQAEMVLSPRSITGAVVDDRKDYSTSYDSATGGFEVRNVVPGEYWLGAFVYAGKGESLASAEPPTLGAILGAKMFALMSLPNAAGQVPVNIVTSDSNDVVLTLGRGITVPVRLQIEGDPSPVVRDLNEIEVVLRPATSNLVETGTPQIKPDGTSTITSVLPGDYRVVVHIPESMALYTRGVLHQRSDVLNNVWQVTSATSGMLDVILSSRGGQIEGTVRDTLNQPAQGVQIVLIPDQPRERLDLYKRATTDLEGRFLFRGIAPGGYKVFAWEAIEEYAYYHADILALYETQGVPVRVQDSSKDSIAIRLIPAAKE